MNLLSSQIASHLNKASMKIQSLSLLIGFGMWPAAQTLVFSGFTKRLSGYYTGYNLGTARWNRCTAGLGEGHSLHGHRVLMLPNAHTLITLQLTSEPALWVHGCFLLRQRWVITGHWQRIHLQPPSLPKVSGWDYKLKTSWNMVRSPGNQPLVTSLTYPPVWFVKNIKTPLLLLSLRKFQRS